MDVFDHNMRGSFTVQCRHPRLVNRCTTNLLGHSCPLDGRIHPGGRYHFDSGLGRRAMGPSIGSNLRLESVFEYYINML